MTRRGAAFTSVNLAYLDRALVLLASIRQHEPDLDVHVVLVDEPDLAGPVRHGLEAFDSVILASELVTKDFNAWVFGYDVVEACTAVKGAALVHLLTRGYDEVIYLDPDMALFGALDTTWESLERHDVAVTPHQLSPETRTQAILDNEIGSLKTGVYNLGYLAVRNTGEGRRFARWWAARLHEWCIDDPARGLFTDQRWMDLAPAFFPTLGVLRDPGMNVASWNLSQREVRFDEEGELKVNGAPLRLFHFTKARGVGPVMTLRYAPGSEAVGAVWRWYLLELDGHQLDVTPDWAYGAFPDGTPIPAHARRLYRHRQDLRTYFPDPFAETPDGGFGAWVAHHPHELG